MAANSDDLMRDDVSRLTARDRLLRQNQDIQKLKHQIEEKKSLFNEFKQGDFKEVRDEMKKLTEMRFWNVGIWKTIAGISVILGILATVIS